MFRTDNENVIFTVDATAIPPIFNQDDDQRVNGFTIGSLGQITPRVAGARQLRVPRHAADQPEPAEQRQAADVLTPEFSGSFWTTYALPRGITLGGGLRYMDDVFVNAAEHDRRAELLAASMRWSSTTSTRTCRCGSTSTTSPTRSTSGTSTTTAAATTRARRDRRSSRRACASEEADAADDSRSAERRTGVDARARCSTRPSGWTAR